MLDGQAVLGTGRRTLIRLIGVRRSAQARVSAGRACALVPLRGSTGEWRPPAVCVRRRCQRCVTCGFRRCRHLTHRLLAPSLGQRVGGPADMLSASVCSRPS